MLGMPQLHCMSALCTSWLSETVRYGGPPELIAGSMRLLLSGEPNVLTQG